MGERRDRTRQRILDGAAAAFARSGFTATSMDDVAAAAGVSRLLLYRDFEGKQELYRAALDRTAARVGDSVLAAATGGAALRELFAVARSDPDGFLLLCWQAPREPAFADVAEAFVARAEEMAEQMLARFEPEPVLRRWAARVAVRQVVDAIVLWLRLGDPALDDAAFHRILAFARSAARPPAPAATAARPVGSAETSAGPVGSAETSATAAGSAEAGSAAAAGPGVEPTDAGAR